MVNITSYSSFNDFSYAQHVHVHLTPCTALKFNGVKLISCTLWRDGSEARRLDVSLPPPDHPLQTDGRRLWSLPMFTETSLGATKVMGMLLWIFFKYVKYLFGNICESQERKIRWVMNWILILVSKLTGNKYKYQ